MPTLSRLRKMTLAELTCRSRQEAFKLIDRIAPAVPRRDARVPGVSHATSRSSDDASAIQEFLRVRAPSFVSTDVATTVRDRWPGAAATIVRAAEQALAGTFSLLGYQDLSFGDPIDWQLDPVSGRRAPLEHWTRVDPLNPQVVGDSKVSWELSRHQWLIGLGQAYRFTGDERYADHAANVLGQWLDANPRGYGINWSSSLELAYRAIAWMWALALLAPSSVITRPVFARLGTALRQHASHIERYLSYYFSPNTHLTGEALGLFLIGSHFPAFRQASRWRELGSRILVEQIDRQVFDDGVYFEQATCYQRYTIEIYLQFLMLAARDGYPVPPRVATRVIRMCEYLRHICRADGSMPSIGDADSGWLLPLTPRRDDDCRGVLATAAAFFGRPELAVGSGAEPEVDWLVGRPDAAAERQLAEIALQAVDPSRLFPSGGYAVMRSDWNADALQLIVDVGPLGCPFSSAHGHADLLSIHCVAFGEPWIVDAGTYCYTSEPEWRTYFRTTAAHSTVVVDDVSQAEPAGPFAWRTRPTTRLRAWRSSSEHDYVDAEHDGYTRLAAPVRHRRRVVFLKPIGWIVFDELLGEAEHRVDLRFHVTEHPAFDGTAAWIGRDGKGIWIVPVAAVPLQAATIAGSKSPIDGWRSDAYGRCDAAPVLSYSARAECPLRIATLILPARGDQGAAPRVAPVCGRDGRLDGIVLPDQGRQIRFDSHTFTVEVL